MASTDQNFDYGSVNRIIDENDPTSLFSNQNSVNRFIYDDKSVDSSSLFPTNLESPSDSGSPSFGSSSNVESTEINKYSNPILRYISDILMDEEDDLEHKPCMLQDCLALQAAEKSFYDVLGPSYPPSPHPAHSFESNSSCASTDRSYESDWSSALRPFPATQAAGYFQYGEGEIMHTSTTAGSREKRSHQLDDTANEDEGRGSKLSAVNSDDSELSEVFDEVLLCLGGPCQSTVCAAPESSSKNGKSKLNVKQANRSKKGANEGTTVDLWTLLTQCAQAVANYDQKNANELLKQIRQNSTPFGDGTQRLAHYFANGLDARLAAGTPSYMLLDSDGATAADMFKAYKLYITVSPFQRVTNFMYNRMIMKEMENESTRSRSLHVIDFGIYYGFQWPCLIQVLASTPGEPIKLRITGIDFPQPGFRPAERIEETGRRLANYCRRYNVPFEYNCLAQKWETIQLKDLKIDRSEITVVNSMYRMKNLPDGTVAVDCPRDAVLKLIRKIKPNIFMNGVANGTYNTPFFMTRFKEAMFHFSTLFDIFEGNNVEREDPHRAMFEKGIFGRDAMNVIACEGAERVERPETYKQWQVRNQRAGFKQIRLDPGGLNKAKEFVKMEYHKNFVVDEDGKWVLLGWKGRITHALSCWKPA